MTRLPKLPRSRNKVPKHIETPDVPSHKSSRRPNRGHVPDEPHVRSTTIPIEEKEKDYLPYSLKKYVELFL
jgi:hypothetical protein